MTKKFRNRNRTTKAVADARGTGEQSERPRCAIGVTGPKDFATRGLQVKNKLDCFFNNRPHCFDKAGVASNEPVMPNTCSDVRNCVGIKFVLFDSVGEVVLVPRTVMTLDVELATDGVQADVTLGAIDRDL